MGRSNPTRAGLAQALRQPWLVGAEVAWRWSFGAAALLLASAAGFGFLDGVVVTNRDLLALGSGNPDLVSAAVAHMFQGEGPRVLHALALLVPAVAFLWVAVASLGRVATLRTLMGASAPVNWFAIVTLHSMRVVLALAAVFAGLGLIGFASWVSTTPDADGFLRPNIGEYLLILIMTLTALILFWSFLNWLLALAPIFVLRNGIGPIRSLRRSVGAFCDYKSEFLGATALTGILRLLALAILVMVSMTAVGIFSAAGFRATLVVLALVTLGYFAVADFLYISRMAAYVKICQGNPLADTASAAPAALLANPALSIETTAS